MAFALIGRGTSEDPRIGGDSKPTACRIPSSADVRFCFPQIINP